MLKPHIAKELRAIVGDNWVMDTPEDCLAYSYDATPLYQSLPDGVAVPGTAEEVAAIVKVCARENIKIVSRGSGSNLSAGTVPVEGGLVIVLTRLNQILEIDQDNLTTTFQPGVITANLHREVEKMGLFYPPDPGSMNISTLGGNIAECAGGLRGLKYGVTKDYIMGLQAVLPNGEILRTGGKSAKDVAGYDLTKLLVGSEGTLAIITEATAKLIPLPETKRTMLAMFRDLTGSARAVSRIIAERIIPATLEFLDNPTIRVVEDFARIGLPTDMGAILMIEQDGPEAVVERDIQKIAEICRKEGAVEVKVADSLEEGAKLMQARRFALSALARVRPTTILEDATVPRARLAEMVEQINVIAKKYNVEICTFGHAGDGNLHPTCMTDERDKEEIHRVEQAFEEIFLAAIKLGGTITGEHGVGAAKMNYLSLKVGETGIEVMKSLKRAIDPQGIMNPGKLFARDTRRRVVVSNVEQDHHAHGNGCGCNEHTAS
ncbi:FAD-linked oxidase C-terminal domain-containing protein [Effusibacillus lacus]|uniref:FAD-binding protein n=1 Tax=Effusibacillus lacus TaxID=1348429 RepID=A0A292YMT4_9BACL|nr:FAD-linked oxidase C-terminal domain-containing protein [Effusibacillus lacus]TCS72327.1 glycolate oxidase [Effusibacillus lacus]GAX90209.1 FAD-binding protein [Effusibacillus lacus]